MSHDVSLQFLKDFQKLYEPMVDYYCFNIKPFRDDTIPETALRQSPKIFFKFMFKTRNEFLDHIQRYGEVIGTREQDAFVIEATHFEGWRHTFSQIDDLMPMNNVRLSPSLHISLNIP